ncbi:hypothetical protein [Mycolicibacterium iranicum]|uniref:hypothetical protein n=1 Tax=Mycolicibacterium iranicum TaxID=912594 RepID=UPI0004B2A0F6|nr:hypothetical protein [Mycolicibacterium iranicum]
MFVQKIDDETTTESGADDVDETTTEQAELESDTTVDTNTDGLDDDGNAGQTEAGASDDDNENSSETGTFSRTYVEKLRRENAGYRERANQVYALAARLHTALVAATGRMADPTDLPFDSAHLDDEQALTDAIDDLLARKPHLANRRPFGDVGQGQQGKTSEPVNLADMLRSRA